MDHTLNDTEVRVLGSLIEKEIVCLAMYGGAINETEDFTLKAPGQVGRYAWKSVHADVSGFSLHANVKYPQKLPREWFPAYPCSILESRSSHNAKSGLVTMPCRRKHPR